MIGKLQSGNVSMGDIPSVAREASPNKIIKSKIMDVHNKKTKELTQTDREQILSRYLNMTNKLNLTYFKGELASLNQEKDEAELLYQDKRREAIYNREDLDMVRLRNGEFRNKITKLEKDNKELHDLRVKQSYKFDEVLGELFRINETIKLYDKRHMKEKLPQRKTGYDVKPFKNVVLTDMKRAVATEGACKTTLQEQIKQLRKLLIEETHQRDELKHTVALQRKKMQTLGFKHIKHTNHLEHGLSAMNDQVEGTAKEALKNIKKLERNTKNMVAA